jgi:hypothetical protein
MQDVTHVTTTEFDDVFEVSSGPKRPTTTHFNLRGTERFRNSGKTVKFLDKFRDSELISENEQWDIPNPTPKNAILIKDQEL